jgi:putative transposase
LLSVWQDEYKAWRKRSFVGKTYTYIWADGVYFNVRLGDDRLACLVIIGVRPDGVKEVIALEDGYRESTESWATLLRDLKRRGLSAPKLAIADGALGFWAALRQVYPQTEDSVAGSTKSPISFSTAFHSDGGWEALRRKVVAEHGEGLELIALA